MKPRKEKVQFLNVQIDNLSMKGTIAEMEELIRQKKPSLVVTPNAHHIYLLKHDKVFREVYNDASLVIADSTAILWASKLFGRPLKERVPGSDLLPSFCKVAANKKIRIFFLGAGPGIAEKAAEILTGKHPGLKITGTYSPPFGFEKNEKENRKIIDIVKKCTPDVLFVGLGSPKSEKWGWKYKDEINVPVTISTGAGFDFIANKVKRAPVWIQKMGMEWFFRLVQEPTRLWKRYLVGNTIFAIQILIEFFKIRILRKN